MSLSSNTLTVCYCQPSKIISDPRSTKLMQQPIPYHMQFDYYMLRDRNFELKANCVCTNCGNKIGIDEQIYTDIQLAIAEDVLPYEGIRVSIILAYGRSRK